MKIKTKSKKLNKTWLHEHINDPYVKMAHRDGFRARAAYKLKEIDETLKLVRPGQVVVDLGASPGASTAVPAMLEVMERCFADQYQGWVPKLKEMVPSLGTKLSGEPALFREVWDYGTKVLKLDAPAPV